MPQLDDAIDELLSRELKRAGALGPRWKVLSDAGGLAVALMIAVNRGRSTVGFVVSRLQACGLASRSRVLGLARTLIHLGGVTSTPSQQDERVRLLTPCGWLPDFLDDWLSGHLVALSKCTPCVPDERQARARLDALLLTKPAALFSAGGLGWLAHAVGGALWLLSVLSSAKREAGATVSAPSLKRLSKVSGVSRAHYAHLRSLAEARGLVCRTQDGALELTQRFQLQGRGLVVRRLALLGATMV